MPLVLPNDFSPIWFHIKTDPLNGLDQRALHATVDHRHEGSTFSLSCQFGALRSHNIFYSHMSLKNKVVTWSFRPARALPNTLVIEFENIRILIPFDAIQKKNILVNKTKDSNEVCLLIPLIYTPYIYRLESDKNDKQNVNNMKQVRYVTNACILISRNFAFSFLDYVLILEIISFLTISNYVRI